MCDCKHKHPQHINEVLPASRNKGEVCSCVGREVARTVQRAGPWKTERSKGINRNDSKTDRKQKTYICVHMMSSFFNTVNNDVAANSGRITGNENHIRLPYFMADEKLINWSGCVLLTCAIFIIKDKVWSLNPVNLLSEKRFKQIRPQTMQIGKKNVLVFFFCHLWTCHLMSLLVTGTWCYYCLYQGSAHHADAIEHAKQPWSRRRRCKDAEEEKGMSANTQLATETDDKDGRCLF